MKHQQRLMPVGRAGERMVHLMKKPRREDLVATSGERFTYVLYYFGQLIFYMIVTGFLQLFLNNIAIPAAIVGTIMIVTKVWDAVNDPIFGVIVDKAKLKGGKYVPWLRISVFLIPVTTILIFCIPSSLSLQLKVILAAGAYILWDTSYTLADVPIYALPTTMTSNIDERDRMYINSKFAVFVGGLLATIAVPILFPAIGWPMTIAILSVLGFLTTFPIAFKAKERFFTEVANPSFMELMRYLVRNKYLLIYHGALILVSLSSTASPVQSFFAIHNLGGTEYISTIALIATVPMILAVVAAKPLLNRFDKVHIAIFCLLASPIIGIAMYFVGYGNLAALYALIAVRAVFGAMSVVLVAMFSADCAEYGNYVTGGRAQGIAFSIQTFTAKITAALSSAICMFLLAIFGFVEGENVQQSASTISAIWSLYTWVPTITAVLAAALLGVGYKLRQKDVAVMIRVNKGELEKDEAAGLMSRNY